MTETLPWRDTHMVLQRALQRITQGLPWLKGTETRLVCYLMEPQPREDEWSLVRLAAPEYPLEPLSLRIPDEAFRFFYEQNTAPRVLSREEVTQTPLLKEIPHVQGFRSFFWLPLRVENEWAGCLLFAHPGRHYFTGPRRALLELAGDLYLLAWQNQLCRESLFAKSQRIYQVEEEVRHRLARDLHDGPAQTLSALVMEAEYLHRIARHDPEAVPDLLVELEHKARKAVNEIRQVLYILRPLALEQGAFRDALEQLVARVHTTFSGRLEVDMDDDVLERIHGEKQRHLFYLIAEALNNAVKHANAQTITLRLKALEPDRALLEIEDDGLGFDTEQAQALRKVGHFGILNMEERAHFLGGEMELQSRPGQGTRIRVVFALEPPDGESGSSETTLEPAR